MNTIKYLLENNVAKCCIFFSRTKVSLDREVSDSFSFLVEAEDGGRPPRRASVPVAVDVLDTNDNDPSFPQKEYRVTVSELEPPGAVVTTLRAHDGDQVRRGLLQLNSDEKKSFVTLHACCSYFFAVDHAGVYF